MPPATQLTRKPNGTVAPVRSVALPPVRSAHLGGDIKGPFRWGMFVIVLLFGVVGTWTMTARLSGAVVAQGSISPEGSRQTVQHLEGGIIQAILAKDGDKVVAGQSLVMIADVAQQADLAAQRSQFYALAAEEARLVAERTHRSEVVFDDPALADRSNPEISQAVARERDRFLARRSAILLRIGVLTQRIAQSKSQIEAYQRQLDGIRLQQGLLREEMSAVQYLVDRGLERKPRLLALERSVADNVGRAGSLEANMAGVKEDITGIELQIADIKSQFAESIEARLADVVTQRRQVEESIRKNLDQIARTAVRAPVSGTVFNSRFKTIGGVIRPGDPILDIVPDHEELIVEAHVSTKDIDEVHVDQPAHIVFPTFPQRHMQRIRGTVIFVAADALVDDKTNQGYYLVKVKIDREHLHSVAPSVRLEAGMPAEVFIATRDRTVIQYLTYPLRVAMQRAMRED